MWSDLAVERVIEVACAIPSHYEMIEKGRIV